MKRIWHNHKKWEDAKNGMYEDYSGDRNKAIDRIVYIFSSKEETERLMLKVIKNWIYACEHNLSNNSMNRIAWIGQACCNIENDFTEDIVRNAWHYVQENYQIQANKIAEDLIKYWEEENA